MLESDLNKIILFDGVCNFCNYWVNFIIDRDKKNVYKFASLQSAFGQQKLKELRFPQNVFDTFILIDGEKYFTKSDAAFIILKELNTSLKIFYPLKYMPKFVRDLVYSLIAKNRYKIFGMRQACRIPTAEERVRFIS